METGSIPLDAVDGAVDLRATLESGQSYLWSRTDGGMYEDAGENAWYHTTVDGEVVRARQTADAIEWAATTDADALLRDLLGLGDDLPAIRRAAPEDPLIARAYDAHWGMRIVRDPFFPCLVSFICSAQMRVERIAAMQANLRETFGEDHTLDGETYHDFPTPERLAAASGYERATALFNEQLGEESREEWRDRAPDESHPSVTDEQ